MFLYNIINFNIRNFFNYNQPEETVKLPILDELHLYMFSFLDEKSQQDVIKVNTFWRKVGIESATSSQIEKIQNFIYQLISNLDHQQFEIRNDFELIYQQNRAELAALPSALPNELKCLSLSSFKMSFLPIKESMIFNLKEILFSMNEKFLHEKFQLLKTEEPDLLKSYFELSWKDYEYESAKKDPRRDAQRSFEFFKMGEFDRAIKAAMEIEEEDIRGSTCFLILIGLLEEQLIDKAHYLEENLPTTNANLDFALPFYRYYMNAKNDEMEKKYQRKIDK